MQAGDVGSDSETTVRKAVISDSGSFMQVSAPIRDEIGQVRVAFGLIIRLESEFTRILSVARSGQPGEIYAFDRTGLLISQSRFEDQLRDLGLLDKKGGRSSALILSCGIPARICSVVTRSNRRHRLGLSLV
ncbi:MAG: hypothetical protein M2R45_03480 [Verrucomicrobia subdivision 3 bacterium]|nr:hypothetical protein [Limisphaerales bacterium]MCS1416669.1 hypothetical protein [Limisphaerales bacterium]